MKYHTTRIVSWSSDMGLVRLHLAMCINFVCLGNKIDMNVTDRTFLFHMPKAGKSMEYCVYLPL